MILPFFIEEKTVKKFGIHNVVRWQDVALAELLGLSVMYY
jgi:hypothetical protein